MKLTEGDPVVAFIKGYLLMISKAIRMNSLVGYLGETRM